MCACVCVHEHVCVYVYAWKSSACLMACSVHTEQHNRGGSDVCGLCGAFPILGFIGRAIHEDLPRVCACLNKYMCAFAFTSEFTRTHRYECHVYNVPMAKSERNTLLTELRLRTVNVQQVRKCMHSCACEMHAFSLTWFVCLCLGR